MVKYDVGTYGHSGTKYVDVTNTQEYYAGENLSDANCVCIKPNDSAYDSFETYADTAALQVVYVDSDGSNKMAALEETNYGTGLKAMSITSAGAANENDKVIRTVSSRDLTGYSVYLAIRGSATSTNFEFRIGSTSGLASNYRYYPLTLSGTNTYEVLTFAVSAMTESGTCDETAIIDFGFHHNGTGTESIIVDAMYFFKAGTTKYAVYKADSSDHSLMPAVGFVDQSYSSGNTVSDIVTGGLLDGFSGLLPGKPVYVSTTAGGVVQFKSLPTIKQRLGTAVSDAVVLVDVDDVA